MDKFLSEIGVIFGGAITLAIVATLVSKNANTASVLQQAGAAGASLIQAATGPVTGNSLSLGSLPVSF